MEEPDATSPPSPWRPRTRPQPADPAAPLESPWAPRTPARPAFAPPVNPFATRPNPYAAPPPPEERQLSDAAPVVPDQRGAPHEPPVADTNPESPPPAAQPDAAPLGPDPYAAPPEPAVPYAVPPAPDPYAPSDAPAGRRRGPLLVVAVLAGLVLVAILATVVIRVTGGNDTTTSKPTIAAAPTAGSELSPTDQAPSEAEPSESTLNLPADPPALIDYTAVAAEPLGPASALVVGDLLQAVNDRRWDDGYRTYSQAWRAQIPEANWERDESTSRHESVVMNSVQEQFDGSVIADVSFVSRQSPGFGPTGRKQETCTQWHLDYTLVNDGDPYYPLSIDSGKTVEPSRPCS